MTDHPESMPILSLWQPWASLMGWKLHETRHWPIKVRGPIAIHAAQRVDRDGAPHELSAWALGADWARTVPRGAVVAVANLTDCIPTETALTQVRCSDLASGNYGPGRYAFRMDALRRLREPIPLTGRQGVFRWTPPADLEAQLLPPVDHHALADAWDRFWLNP